MSIRNTNGCDFIFCAICPNHIYNIPFFYLFILIRLQKLLLIIKSVKTKVCISMKNTDTDPDNLLTIQDMLS